jgi:phospholipid/cholesterol/gamma-HCH transport system substrate-binding protein
MKISREFKIGLTALITIALTIWGINFLKGRNIFKSTNTYYAVYSNVKGLVENAVVYLNGYKVGNVTKIAFDEKDMTKVIVEIAVEKRVRLLKNSSMVLRSGSLISGTKDVDLEPGPGPDFCQSGDTLVPMIEAELTDFIEPLKNQISSVVTTVDTLMMAMEDLLSPETRRNLQGTISNLQGATSSLKRSLQPSGSLYQSLDNLSAVTGNLKESNENISVMLNNLAIVSDSLKEADLKALIMHANETFAKTSELFTMINNGEGTTGQLVVNDSLYHNLNSAVASLDSLLIDLREHPKRYVHLSVFGKKE